MRTTGGGPGAGICAWMRRALPCQSGDAPQTASPFGKIGQLPHRMSHGTSLLMGARQQLHMPSRFMPHQCSLQNSFAEPHTLYAAVETGPTGMTGGHGSEGGSSGDDEGGPPPDEADSFAFLELALSVFGARVSRRIASGSNGTARASCTRLKKNKRDTAHDCICGSRLRSSRAVETRLWRISFS